VSATHSEAPLENTGGPAPEESTDVRFRSRALMDTKAREGAETQFLEFVNFESPGIGFADEQLVKAGNVACDGMDHGDSSKSIFSAVGALLPDASAGSVPIVAVVASGTLCPEHRGYEG
jgi:hypothetical protein